MTQQTAADKPTSIVIFGASGDLTHRKLIPALFNLFRKHRLRKPRKRRRMSPLPVRKRSARRP